MQHTHLFYAEMKRTGPTAPTISRSSSFPGLVPRPLHLRGTELPPAFKNHPGCCSYWAVRCLGFRQLTMSDLWCPPLLQVVLEAALQVVSDFRSVGEEM